MSREYQQKFVADLLPAAWSAGNKSVLLTLPVGGGKTRAARMVVERLLGAGGWDVLVLDHRKELTEQFSVEFAHLNPSVYWAGKPGPPPSVLRIAGRDTIARRDWVPLHDRLFLIIDEAHHVSERNTYGRLLARFRDQYRVVYVLGLTATPYRLDGKPLGKVFDALVEPTTPLELIESGVIVEPRIIGADSPDLRGLRRAAGDFVSSELELRSKKLVGNVVEEWKRWSDGYPGVVRASSIAHSRVIVDRMRKAGFRFEHLDGETPAAERDLTLARLAIGGKRGSALGLDGVSQVDIASEGWNPPSDHERVLKLKAQLWPTQSEPPPYVPLCLLSDCRPTLSRSGYRQFEGRGSRPGGDVVYTSQGPMPALPKPWFRLVSHSENWRRFGALRDHYGFDLETGAVLGESRVPRDKDGLLSCCYCPRCLSVWPLGTKSCACGAPLSDPKLLPQESAEKLAPLGARPDATEQQTVGYLTALWKSHARKNRERAARGEPPISDNQVRCIFHSYAKRWPSNVELAEAKKNAGL